MTRYIIRPRELEAVRALRSRSVRLDPGARMAQRAAVVNAIGEDESIRELGRWVDESEKLRGLKSPMSGSVVIDLSAEQVARLQRELPALAIIADRPLEVIRPIRTLARKADVTGADLWHLEAVGLVRARARGLTLDGRGVGVAVLDTGIDPKHPELRDKIGQSWRVDVDGQGPGEVSTSIDTDGHGTHVAGLIAGTSTGVAPGVKLFDALMLPKGRGHFSDFIWAMEWAASRPDIQIVNISAGIPGFIPEMHEAVASLLTVGLLPVVAVGNEGRNLSRSPGNYVEVVSVGATTRSGRVAALSGGGDLVVDHHRYTVPDLVAPGLEIYSAAAGGGYEALDGTSMAAPIVSGVASLWLEKYPRITVAELSEALFDGCLGLGQPVARQGAGLVQVSSLLDGAA